MSTSDPSSRYPVLSRFLIIWFGDGENVAESLAEFKSRAAEMEQRNSILAEGRRLLNSGDDAALVAVAEWANRPFDREQARIWLNKLLSTLEA